jgi:hypothetical protein
MAQDSIEWEEVDAILQEARPSAEILLEWRYKRGKGGEKRSVVTTGYTRAAIHNTPLSASIASRERRLYQLKGIVPLMKFHRAVVSTIIYVLSQRLLNVEFFRITATALTVSRICDGSGALGTKSLGIRSAIAVIRGRHTRGGQRRRQHRTCRRRQGSSPAAHCTSRTRRTWPSHLVLQPPSSGGRRSGGKHMSLRCRASVL